MVCMHLHQDKYVTWFILNFFFMCGIWDAQLLPMKSTVLKFRLTTVIRWAQGVYVCVCIEPHGILTSHLGNIVLTWPSRSVPNLMISHNLFKTWMKLASGGKSEGTIKKFAFAWTKGFVMVDNKIDNCLFVLKVAVFYFLKELIQCKIYILKTHIMYKFLFYFCE